MARASKPQHRFGIGEWYGKSFVNLTSQERRHFAEIQQNPQANLPSCRFLSTKEHPRPCWKTGGVCSLRSYEQAGKLVHVDPAGGTLRATCPSRFEEDGEVYRWIGEVLLGNSDAVPVGQVPFLERVPTMGGGEVSEGEGVGRIDNVLIVPGTTPLQWCAVEVQAVYFSGDKMADDFRAIRRHQADSIPFPAGRRRPDYRSSGPITEVAARSDLELPDKTQAFGNFSFSLKTGAAVRLSGSYTGKHEHGTSRDWAR
ncbi:MAG: NotI family restriction endonuclease, partial [Gemmataceae bacterium]